MLSHEKEIWQEGYYNIAGVDEAGRGPLAGPVVAAAVIFSQSQPLLLEINDSKKLSAKARERAFCIIQQNALAIGIGIVPPKVIDEINILQATYSAMKVALKKLTVRPDYILIDGNRGPVVKVPSRFIVKGDSKSMSIAAASIIAKVTRDKIMRQEDMLYPQYGFARHKGYPTRFHIEAIREHGYSKIHRKSFHPKSLENK